MDREFHGKQAHNHLLLSHYGVTQEQCTSAAQNSLPPHTLNIDIAMQQQQGWCLFVDTNKGICLVYFACVFLLFLLK